MIKIKLQDKSIDLKNDVTEIKIGTFEKICTVFNDKKLDYIDKYIETLMLLDITEEELSEISAEYFLDIIKEINLVKPMDKEFKQYIEIDGYIYKSFEDGKNFILTVRDLAKIENYIKRNQTEFIGEMLAIIYKRVDLTSVEHYTDSHIKYKADLFRKNITADISIPYLTLMTNKIIKNIEDVK